MNSDFGNFLSALPDILNAAAKSGLGILGLLIVVLGVIGYVFFNKAPINYRLGVYLVLCAGAASFGAALFKVTPTVMLQSPLNSAAPVATSGRDSSNTAAQFAQCVDRHLTDFRARQSFSQPGGVSCHGGGPFGQGDTQRRTITYSAPPGYTIIGNANIVDHSNINGSFGAVAYHSSGPAVDSASVDIQCSSPNQPFGPGGSMQVSIDGFVEKVVTPEARRDAESMCRRSAP